MQIVKQYLSLQKIISREIHSLPYDQYWILLRNPQIVNKNNDFYWKWNVAHQNMFLEQKNHFKYLNFDIICDRNRDIKNKTTNFTRMYETIQILGNKHGRDIQLKFRKRKAVPKLLYKCITGIIIKKSKQLKWSFWEQVKDTIEVTTFAPKTYERFELCIFAINQRIKKYRQKW